MAAVPPSPFRDTSRPPSRNWLFRILRIGRRGDTQQLVERLFADRDPSAVSAVDVSEVLRQAKLSGSGARKVLIGVWAKALSAFLADDLLTDTESGYLQRLRVPLGVTEREVQEVERELVHPRYQKAVQEVLADGRLTDLEQKALKRFASYLRLPEQAQALIYQPAAQAAYDGALKQSMSDERFSADEQAGMTALAPTRNPAVARRSDPSAPGPHGPALENRERAVPHDICTDCSATWRDVLLLLHGRLARASNQDGASELQRSVDEHSDMQRRPLSCRISDPAARNSRRTDAYR